MLLLCRASSRKPLFVQLKVGFMSIQFQCVCGQKFSVPDQHAGKKSKCAKCNAIIKIPVLDDFLETQKIPEIPAETKEKTKRSKAPAAVEKEREPTKECPFCAKEISAKAKECEHCGESISVSKRAKARNNTRSILKYQKVSHKTVIMYTLFTLGIYHLFFVHRVFKELKRRRLTSISPMRAVGFFFIPFFNLAWVFIVWHEIGNALEMESQNDKYQDTNFGLIRNWAIGFFINPFTLFLGTPILIIVMAIVFGKTQRVLNQLPDLTEEDLNRQVEPAPSLYATFSFYFACVSLLFGLITGIPAILMGHLAVRDAKRGAPKEKQKAFKSLVLAYGITIGMTLVWVFLESSHLSSADFQERKNQSIIQLQTINTYASLYEANFKKPIQSLEDILKLKEASSKAFTSPLSKLPYVFFPAKNVAPKNYNSWLEKGTILVYEEIPDSKGYRIYLGKNHEVVEMPEAEFQALLKNEIKLYGAQ